MTDMGANQPSRARVSYVRFPPFADIQIKTLPIVDPGSQILVSAASVWEVAIKRRLGKLAFAGSPSAAISANGFFALPILPIDAEGAGSLSWDHSDPFDRMLVAQAKRAGLTLVTADSLIRAHDGLAVFWAG